MICVIVSPNFALPPDARGRIKRLLHYDQESFLVEIEETHNLDNYIVLADSDTDLYLLSEDSPAIGSVLYRSSSYSVTRGPLPFPMPKGTVSLGALSIKRIL